MSSATCDLQPQDDARAWAAFEVALIFLLFFIHAGWPTPDVNEAHYLAKAKYYWNPAWCRTDNFLRSADAHLVFYWTFGWLTRFFSLPATAWIGRVLTWLLMAWSWRRLNKALIPSQRLVSVLTAALFIGFQHRLHMAGEWVIGGVEAKGFAYVLVFLAMEAMTKGRWKAVWPLLGAASAFHVLVGGWAVIAAGCAWLACGKHRARLVPMLPYLGLGLLLSLLGVVPGLILNSGVDVKTAQEASRIYVFERLRHHLVFYSFPPEFMLRHLGLLSLWIVTCVATPCKLTEGKLGQRPLRGFVGGAIVIALIGIVIDQLLRNDPKLAAPLLRYYWFRLSDVMLPIGAAISLTAFVCGLRQTREKLSQSLLAILIAVATTNMIVTYFQRHTDMRPGADFQTLSDAESFDARRTRKTNKDEAAALTKQIYLDWVNTCEWISQNTPPEARFLTPYRQQTFKWYAERAEANNWKDVPQDAKSLIQWRKRQQHLYPPSVLRGGLPMHGAKRIVILARRYKVNYIVVDRVASRWPLPLPRIYPSGFGQKSHYEVYWVPPE